MTGRITRLIDDQQLGTISAEDGLEYVFQSMALSQTKFSDLSLGAAVAAERYLKLKNPDEVLFSEEIADFEN